MEMCGRLRGALCLSMMLLWTSSGSGNDTTPALKLRVIYNTGKPLVQKELYFPYPELQWFYSCLCQGRSRMWSVPLAAVNESTLKIASATEDCLAAVPPTTGIYQCTLFAPYHKGSPALTCTKREMDVGLCPDRSNSPPEAQCLSLTMVNSRPNICRGECMDFLWDPSQWVKSAETTNSHLHLGSCRSVKSTTTLTSISSSTDDKVNTTDVGGGNTEISNAGSNTGLIAGIATGVVVLIIITIVVILWTWRKHKLLTSSNSVPSNYSAVDSRVVAQQSGSSLRSESEITMPGTQQTKVTTDANKDEDGYMLMNIPHINEDSNPEEMHYLRQDKDYCTMSYGQISKDLDGTNSVRDPATTEDIPPGVSFAERKSHCSNPKDQSNDAVYTVVCKKSTPMVNTLLMKPSL